MDEGTAKSYSDTQAKKDKLKWKKITDYTKDIHTSYKTLRNINNITVYEHETYLGYTWVGTHYSGSTSGIYTIHPSGVFEWHNTPFAGGLRPVITK